MNITIREYTDQDRPAILAGIIGLQQFIVDTDPMKRQVLSPGYGETYTDTLLKAVAEKDGKIYLAEENGEVLGFIAGTIQPETPGGTLEVIPSRVAWIRELYAHEKARGKGVGTLLVETLETYFKSKGCDVVQVGVFAPSTDTHGFYESKGFVDRDITMLKRI